MTTLAVVICTFRREDLLAKALASLTAQTMPEGLSAEIIVVDNSDEGSAAGVVARAAAGSAMPMRRIEAHPANISVARNAGVAATAADFVAFLDDDQQTEPGWLAVVGAALAKLPHDAFFGAVEPEFEAPQAATPAVWQLFSRRLDAPSGQDLVAMGPQKTRGIALATNNSIFRRSAMLIGTGPFDLSFGNGGGEDYDLICRMQQRGSRLAWLPEARAREFVPAARCEAGYLRRRFYAGGQAFAAAVANASAAPGRTRWLVRLKALVQAGLLTLRLPLVLVRGGAGLADYAYSWAGVLGKLSFGGIHPIYRAADKPAPAASSAL